VSLPHLRFNSRLICPDTFYYDHLFLFCQELGSGWRVGEEEAKHDEDRKCYAADDDHEPLPLSDFGVICWDGGCCCRGRNCRPGRLSMVCTECDESGDDGRKTIALESPPNAFAHFSTSIEHGIDQHDARSNASLTESKEETDRYYRGKSGTILQKGRSYILSAL
jgi:hypothetical protein